MPTESAPSIHDAGTWFPAGTPAVQVWMCGRCCTELVAGDDVHYCEVCGARYHGDTGHYLGGSGPATV